MGLIKAAVSAIGSGLADQWLEFLEADEMGEGTVFTGAKAVRPGKGSNTKGSADYVSNGSRIVVQKNQFMMLVDGGKIVEQGTHDELMALQAHYYKMWNEYQKSVAWKL